MSAGGKVTLESRQKLPQKVQDVICDVGLALQNAVQASPSSETVPVALKTMAAMDSNNEAISENLQKMDELLDQLDEDYQEMTDNNKYPTEECRCFVTSQKVGTRAGPWRILSTFLNGVPRPNLWILAASV